MQGLLADHWRSSALKRTERTILCVAAKQHSLVLILLPSLLKVNSGVIASRIRGLSANASISLHCFFLCFWKIASIITLFLLL